MPRMEDFTGGELQSKCVNKNSYHFQSVGHSGLTFYSNNFVSSHGVYKTFFYSESGLMFLRAAAWIWMQQASPNSLTTIIQRNNFFNFDYLVSCYLLVRVVILWTDRGLMNHTTLSPFIYCNLFLHRAVNIVSLLLTIHHQTFSTKVSNKVQIWQNDDINIVMISKWDYKSYIHTFYSTAYFVIISFNLPVLIVTQLELQKWVDSLIDKLFFLYFYSSVVVSEHLWVGQVSKDVWRGQTHLGLWELMMAVFTIL